MLKRPKKPRIHRHFSRVLLWIVCICAAVQAVTFLIATWHAPISPQLVIGMLVCIATSIGAILVCWIYLRRGMIDPTLAKIQEAEIARRAAEEANTTKSKFLATMSHELRTPLNAILGISELQLEDDELSDTDRDALERINSSGTSLLGIVNELLDLSKIESGKFELVPLQYYFSKLINDTVRLNHIRIIDKPIDFRLDIEPGLPSVLFGDELRIRQILNNVLSNAFKYTEEGTVTMRIAACPDEKTPGDENILLVFTISDTGQGMSQDQIDKLFDEYSRFNLEANRETEGSGLGMNITQSLVGLMGGIIVVDSQPGIGSVFTVSLPQLRVGGEVLDAETTSRLCRFDYSVRESRPDLIRFPMPYGRVLVVDDSESNLYVSTGMLGLYDLKIDTAQSGAEAIKKIRKGAWYDIIFMDHMMPKMDGVECTRILREDLDYTGVIYALTANVVKKRDFAHWGFDGYVGKPINTRRLNKVLNQHIRDKYPEEAAAAERATVAALPGDSQEDRRLLELFLADAEHATERIRFVVGTPMQRENDLNTFVLNVHSMKSAAKNMGEKILAHRAGQLEIAGKEKNIAFIREKTPEFLERLEDFSARVRKKLPQPQETTPESPETRNTLAETLAGVAAAAKEYDEDEATGLLRRLDTVPASDATRSDLRKIALHLLHSEFEEASALSLVLAEKMINK